MDAALTGQENYSPGKFSNMILILKIVQMVVNTPIKLQSMFS
jgi:hypothetical protein